MENRPYISFVVAARNDDYGGNFLHRMQVFVNVLLGLAEKHSLNLELIVVEWNPPAGKESLSRAISWPSGLKSAKVRFIEVPLETHRKVLGSDKLLMFEFLAKNVGIRRAKGEYMVVTNPDIIFNDELIGFLASKKLSPECFYRMDRYDVKKTIPLNMSVKEQLDFCEKNWTAVRTMKADRKRAFPYFDYSNLRSILSRIRSMFIRDPRTGIHTNASGDFFLMARSEWNKLRGYPELPLPCFVDGYMCFIAASSGLPQVILNSRKRIYHQSHGSYINRADFSKEYETYKECAKQMARSNQSLITNDENWGLAGEKLKENYPS